MIQFLYDPDHIDLVDVALRNHMEFFVKSTVSHRGSLNRSTIEFLIKWRNYPESENSWEPFSNLRDNAIPHDYLKLKKIASFDQETR